MKVLKAKSKWFAESDLRLDAEYHLSDGSESKRLILKSPCQLETLGSVSSDIFSGKIFRRVFVDSAKNGFPYLTASDMVKSDIFSGKYISKKYTSQINELEIKAGWILLSCSGTLGNTVFTNEYFNGRIGTHDLIRIIPNSKKIKPGFLYAYLRSKYGYSLLVQPSYGGVVKHIEPHHIENLPIPLLPEPKQKEIHALILEASQLRKAANELLSESEESLLSKIGITAEELTKLNSPYESDVQRCFGVKLKKLNTYTLRARNYSKRKEIIISRLSEGKWDKLIDVLSNAPTYGARFKRIESRSANGIELLSQGDIFLQKPTGRKISKKSIKNFEDELVRKGTTLIPAQGTLGENEIFGRAKFVWGYLENKLVAGHAMRFIPNIDRIGSGYLYAVLSSPLWFRILRDSVYGTNLLGFIVNLIQEYPIPRFHKSFENRIDALVKEAYEKLTQANMKEDEAISVVENEISKWQK